VVAAQRQCDTALICATSSECVMRLRKWSPSNAAIDLRLVLQRGERRRVQDAVAVAWNTCAQRVVGSG
jgi:hypothetical protein